MLKIRNSLFTLAALSVAAVAAVSNLDISQGNITITGTGFTSSGSASETAFTGSYVISGNSDENTITVEAGTHDITISSLVMNLSDESFSPFMIDSGAAVNLTLSGENALYAGNYSAGVAVSKSATLVITEESDGSLDAKGGLYGAGIGGYYSKSGGSIGSGGSVVINGGTVVATGGSYGAGVGSGYSYGADSVKVSVEVNGGTITAIGGSYGAGVGGGYYGSGGKLHETAVTINDGTVTATGGSYGAGVGSGYAYGADSVKVSVEVNGGTVTAIGGSYGAGVGSGYYGSGGKLHETAVTINDGTVTATGGSYGAGIGSSFSYGIDSLDMEISISGGNVAAAGGEYGAGIGSGNYGDCGTVNVFGEASVTAVGGAHAAGVGSGASGSGGTVNIFGNALVKATGGSRTYGGAGIGSGYNGNGGTTAGIVNIYEAAFVTATGGYRAAGIGGGRESAGGEVNVLGGTVIASGGYAAAGVGGSYNGSGGNVNLSGGIVIANAGNDAPNAIGAGAGGEALGEVAKGEALVFENAGTAVDLAGHISGSSFTLSYDCIWPAGYTLNIPEGYSLTVASGYTLTNYGTINAAGNLKYAGSYGSFENEGTLTNEIPTPIVASKKSPSNLAQFASSGRGISVKANSAVKAFIYNLRGELAKSAEFPSGGGRVSGLKPGAYMVKLSNGAKGMVTLR